MSETPPTKYVAYPRGDYFARTHGSVERLEALGDGYFGMTRAAIFNFLITLIAILFMHDWGVYVLIPLMVVVIFLLSLPYARKLAFGFDWPDHRAEKVAIAMGINGCIVFGFVGYFILEHIARKELRRYGVRSAWSGIAKPEFTRVLTIRMNADYDPPPQFDIPDQGL